jgi:hypothetical protein
MIMKAKKTNIQLMSGKMIQIVDEEIEIQIVANYSFD